jgi:hypothetical protein
MSLIEIYLLIGAISAFITVFCLTTFANINELSEEHNITTAHWVMAVIAVFVAWPIFLVVTAGQVAQKKIG